MLRRVVPLLVLSVFLLGMLPSVPPSGEPTAAPTEHTVLHGLPPAAGDAAAAGLSERVTTPIPFSLVGVSIPEGTRVSLRTADDAGTWSDWVEPDPLGDDGPDPGSAEAANAKPAWQRMSEPVWVGEASSLQMRVEGGAPDDIEVHLVDSLGLSRSLSQRAGDALRAAWHGAGPSAAEAANRPSIVTRAQWGADESWRKGGPRYSDKTRAGIIHHTAGSNSYSRSQAPGVIRGIYRYHTQSLGWDDIGYNLLVDRYGTVYEGRYGGVDRGVIGAHSGGFNTETFGVAILGTFSSSLPPQSALDATAQTFSWKFRVHGINSDPNATVVMTSRGSSRYPEGHQVRLHTLAAHRDVSTTACPGDALNRHLPELRKQVHARSLAFSPLLPDFGIPISGDWNGDGISTPGFYRNGVALLRLTNTSGAADITFSYGRAGDRPVVGDWDGNGTDTLGIVRGNEWHLRNSLNGGPAHVTFPYGVANDTPVAGDWNGNGQDTVGIVRGSTWHLRNSLSGGSSQISFNYGRLGDRPVPGNWTGSKIGTRDTPGVVRGSTWYLRNSLSGGAADSTFPYGRSGDDAITGSWQPLGPDTIGVVRGETWYLRHHLSGGPASQTFTYRG